MVFFKYDSSAMRFLAKAFDVVCLNVFFTACCLPGITIEPALCGLYRGCLCVCRGEAGAVKAMWKTFRSDFRQALLLWLGELLAGAVLILLCFCGGVLDGSVLTAIPVLVLAVLYVMQFVFALPLLSRFENGIWGTLKNAVLLSLRYFPITVVLIIINALPVLLYLLSPELCLKAIWFWAVGVYGALSCLEVLLIEKYIFAKYIQ